ncbi:hemin uptake hemP family protein [Burkholderia oklahomensis]|uniref:Hemin uptake hemP family protein n=1 Tax=Burkholderia oklahomensis TaxID=342113 RepID=A0AAI8BDC4_9BURK|nr:hemin uptake protein HemP [Burkholderia oklahomensis]AIO70187.1 hemin uptake hemP family protein [Burkholderia oklahomensis]AOI40021.1 hemin transporter HemP [Burkholderia oklahomensis EO147]KUY56339.1 hemin transporter HemP [Burkholderia oklahomensis EO147]QPS39611.1 hemin uptake protein HemP [Burkholderia oklahomensis]
MTESMRSTTLTLRRTGGAASSSRPKTAAVTTPAESVKSTAKPAAAANAGQRVVNSDTLLQGQSHVSIAHNGETYQLRATRLGKLILTK